MIQNQRTVQSEIVLSGPGLHTGGNNRIVIKPAQANQGIRFLRADMPGRPEIALGTAAAISNKAVGRCTAIQNGDAIIYTVEHLMSALCGLGIDNVVIEVSGEEIPGLDGSSLEYLKAIKKAGIVDLGEPKKYFEIKEPIAVSHNGASVMIVPASDFRISYALNYDHPLLYSQFCSTVVSPEVYEKDIAPCRTFCLEREVKELVGKGLGKGANYQNTLVVSEKGVVENTLRFPDEFVRHKVLDCIGDLYLMGTAIRGHVFATKSGHALNRELLLKIFEQKKRYEQKGFVPVDIGQKTELNIQEISKILPHRYPFLLVDRVLHLEKGKKAIGYKNVTINDNFFTGHFPTRPLMPGVLMIEAMAQLGGIVVLTNEEHRGKLALFMAVDKVKFRKLVTPGDQLMMEVEILRDRSKIAQLQGVAKVNGEVVCEAELMVSFTEASFLD